MYVCVCLRIWDRVHVHCVSVCIYIHVYVLCLDVYISASVCVSCRLHEGVWWRSTPLIGQFQGALKPFAYIWNFWISKPLFSIQISSACLTDGQFQCDPSLFACDLYCRDSCILFGCSRWLLSRFFSLILLACSLCRNSWNIHSWTVAFPYLYVQLLAAVLLCRAILIVGIGLG